MSRLRIGLLVLGSMFMLNTNAEEVILTHGVDNSIEVVGCAQDEVPAVSIKNTLDSKAYKVKSRCLPVFCAYTNETAITWFGTKWTIKLLARDISKDSRGVFKGDPQFDRRFNKTLHNGIKTEEGRDELIQEYIKNGTCRDVYYDKNIPAV